MEVCDYLCSLQVVDPAETRSLLDEDQLEANLGADCRPRLAMEDVQPDLRAPQAKEEEEEDEDEEEDEEEQEEEEEGISVREEGERSKVEMEARGVSEELHCPPSPSTPSPSLTPRKVSPHSPVLNRQT